MPSGIYERIGPNFGQFKKGVDPHNKGIQRPDIKKKVERLKLGLEINCKHHGYHKEWRLSDKINNVQCKICRSDYQKKDLINNPLKYLARWTKTRDKSSEITQDILESLLIEQGSTCALTGLRFDADNKPSIDRIDSSIGYKVSNIQLVLFDVNRMKSDFTMDKFLHLCSLIHCKAGKTRKKRKK